MPGTAGPNLGLVWGYSPHESGWGVGGFNPGFSILDTIVQLGIIGVANTPPGSPTAGDRYIVGSAPTGAFVGHANAVAVWLTIGSSAWVFYPPKQGWQAYRADEDTFYYFDGVDWLPVVATTLLVPTDGTNGQVLTKVAGVPAWADPTGGAGAVDFVDGGAWNGTAAYDAFTVVTDAGSIWLTDVAIPAPTGTPGLDGSATGSGGGTGTLVLGGLTTAGAPDTVLVAVAYNSDTITVPSITSTSGLTFVQRASQIRTIISGHKTNLQIWSAPAGVPLTGEIITVNFSGSPSSTRAVAWGAFGGDVTTPLDANASLPKQNTGDRTTPSVTALSTTTADDLLFFVVASDSDGGAGLVDNAAPATFTLLSYLGNATNDNTPNVINLNVSYKVVAAAQSGITITGTGDPSCWAAIAHAAKISGAANLHPAADPRWIRIGGVTSALLDSVFGSTQGSLLVRTATGWQLLGPGAANTFLKTAGPGADLLWSSIPGSGGGLFAGVMSAAPSAANTGFSTWVNQGSASVVDSLAGIILVDGTSGSSIAIRARSMAAPSTPYKRKALISITVNPNAQTPSAGIGWYDGTKFHVIGLGYNNTSKLWQIEIDKLSTVTTFFGGDGTTNANAGIIGPRIWLQIEDNGTTIFFRFSHNGADESFYTLFSIAKASGYLGSGGYSNLVFYMNPQAGTSAGNVYAALESFG